MVGPEQRPVLEVGLLLDGVGSDLLDEVEEAEREGVESDDVGQVHVVEDRLQELRVARVVVVVVGQVVEVEDGQPDEGRGQPARSERQCQEGVLDGYGQLHFGLDVAVPGAD